MNKIDLQKAIDVLQSAPPEDKQVHDMVAGKKYYESLEKLPPMPHPPHGMLGGYLGINIVVSDIIPDDLMVARNKAGEILQVFKLAM